MDGIYLARDVWAVHMTLTVHFRKPEPANSWFGYYAYWLILSVRFECEADGKINFNHIYLKLIFCCLQIYLICNIFSYKLRLLDVSQVQWSFLWRRMCGVKIAKTWCSSLLTIMLNTLWYVRSTIFFCELLSSWIEFDDFIFNFQETYNSRLKERYEYDPSTHPNSDPDLWMR